MEIVPFAPEHAPGFRALVAAVLGEFGFREDPELDSDLIDPRAHYDAVWVVLRHENVVGSVAMRRVDEATAELKRMYLDAEVRGRGLGKRLLATALAWARGQGFSRVVLDTTDSMHAARALYESAGFERTGTRTERGAVDSRCEVLYALELSRDKHLQAAES